ncbi:tetratricopeptide repeat protein [Mesonia maritima]|uniref:Tetratricopeptide (TPR) repeat protein n=1 Tax=Mesonia maritima TaxID=1793873 RepID=A0ABU1KCU9_9FLAO|nr:tetratricopeptide repeat protein [Mesonia maritima]MDR6302297.1 tetratricopeptide (TPR) repeat protein [Mesonia maritima]
MKNIILIISICIISSCKPNKQDSKKDITSSPIEDNAELIEIYKNDQADRQTTNIDWGVVSKRDSLREVRVYQLLDSNKVKTSRDYHNAAMIFQHGGDSTAYGMAVKLMRKSIELDSTANKWLLAAAIDRHLLSKNEPQIYGTQYHKMGDQPWVLAEIDTTKITDAQRREYGVETLAEQREKVKRMNKKELAELLDQGKSVKEVITFIKSENNDKTNYDISENGINSFGYDLMGQQKEDALLIFKLNTALYPNAYNTWDSLGECLLALGKKEEGIQAYKKSLALNPNNQNAKRIIEENK